MCEGVGDYSEARRFAKPVTSVQHSVSSFVSLKPLDTLYVASRHFPAVFVATKSDHS